VDDYFEVLLYYPNLRVRLHSTYIAREPVPGYILHGTKGSFLKGRTDVQETALQAGKTPGSADWGQEPLQERGLLHTEENGSVIKEFIPSLPGNYNDYYSQVYRAIREQQPVPVSAMDALNVIRVIAKAFESSRARLVVNWSA
jgi:scyllo-inositol 2-dehydrogenase (NADP+)